MFHMWQSGGPGGAPINHQLMSGQVQMLLRVTCPCLQQAGAWSIRPSSNPRTLKPSSEPLAWSLFLLGQHPSQRAKELGHHPATGDLK